MSDTWQVLEDIETRKHIVVDYGDCKQSKTITENCLICCSSGVRLVGKYGTCNEFGSFKGICDDCIDRIIKLRNDSLEDKE